MSNAELLEQKLVEPSFEQVEKTGFELNSCPEAVLFFVAKLAVLNPAEKPSVAALEVLVFDDSGQTKKVKPTSAERDQAYDFYKSLESEETLQESSQELPPREKVFLEFLGPYGRYTKGDKTTFDAKNAERILSFKPPVAEVYKPES